MADKKITALTAATAVTTDDLFHIVDSPGSSHSNKKITTANSFNKVPTFIGMNSFDSITAPATAAIPVTTAVSQTTLTGTATGGTIAAGSSGQLKVTMQISGAHVHTLTPILFAQGTTVVTTGVGDTCTFLYSTTTTAQWWLISSNDASAAANLVTT